MLSKKLIIFTLIFSFNTFAQQSASSTQKQSDDMAELERIKREDFNKMKEHIRKQMEEQNSYLKKYFHGKLFENFEKNFERVFDQFDPEMSKKLQDLFGDDDFSGFDRLFQDAFLNPNMMPDTHEWKETPKSHILILKMKTVKDSPLDIKIEKSKVTIKATVLEEITRERAGVKSYHTRQYQLNRVFPVPPGTDPDGAKFENKDGHIYITFPKTAQTSKPLNKGRKGIKPLKPSKKDRTI